VVTKPFDFEGVRKMRVADAGIDALVEHVDSLIVVLNQKLFEVMDEDATLQDAFKQADNVLHNAVAGIAEIINVPGFVNVDFADVRTVMAEQGKAMMGIGEAAGMDRARIAAEQAVASPLLDGVDLNGARGVIVNITASSSLSLRETNEVINTIRHFCSDDATIIHGTVFDEKMADSLRVTVVATGIGRPRMVAKPPVLAKAPLNVAALQQSPNSPVIASPGAAHGLQHAAHGSQPAAHGSQHGAHSVQHSVAHAMPRTGTYDAPLASGLGSGSTAGVIARSGTTATPSSSGLNPAGTGTSGLAYPSSMSSASGGLQAVGAQSPAMQIAGAQPSVVNAPGVHLSGSQSTGTPAGHASTPVANLASPSAPRFTAQAVGAGVGTGTGAGQGLGAGPGLGAGLGSGAAPGLSAGLGSGTGSGAGLGTSPGASMSTASSPLAASASRAPAGGLDTPTVWRDPRAAASARVAALEESGVEKFDIPAFLRRQAD